jgi:hypothetical protein
MKGEEVMDVVVAVAQRWIRHHHHPYRVAHRYASPVDASHDAPPG